MMPLFVGYYLFEEQGTCVLKQVVLVQYYHFLSA